MSRGRGRRGSHLDLHAYKKRHPRYVRRYTSLAGWVPLVQMQLIALIAIVKNAPLLLSIPIRNGVYHVSNGAATCVVNRVTARAV